MTDLTRRVNPYRTEEHAIAEDVPDQDPPADHGAGGYQRSPGYWHRRPAMWQSLVPLCSTTVSDHSVDENRCCLAHCGTVLHARRHLLSGTPGHGSSSPLNVHHHYRRATMLNEVWPSHDLPVSFSHNDTQIVRNRKLFHQKTSRCCACQKHGCARAGLHYSCMLRYASRPWNCP